jgi:hypothetical protein
MGRGCIGWDGKGSQTEIDHHKRCVCVGTKLPPPSRTSALLALPGPEIDSDHAVVIAAAAMKMAIAMLLHTSSSISGLNQTIGIADDGKSM